MTSTSDLQVVERRPATDTGKPPLLLVHDLMLDARWREPLKVLLDWLSAAR